MDKRHVCYLKSPKNGNDLLIKKVTEESEGKIKEGILSDEKTGDEFPITNFIPRFVPKDNYANNFGIEWNIHSKTQYDSLSMHNISHDRFQNSTNWDKNLEGEIILEAGSGSGRFTSVAAESGALIITFDYSNAVEANYKSNGSRNNVLIVQADILSMPFNKDFFDKIFCFGVLQHTPSPYLSLNALVDVLKNDGSIVTDIYIKNFKRAVLTPKYFLRLFTKRMDTEKLYIYTSKYIDFMWPLARIIRKIPKIGYLINWRLMIPDCSSILQNADDKTLKEWAYLDIYDGLSPKYDIPATKRTFQNWHKKLGLSEINVFETGHGLVARAKKI